MVLPMSKCRNRVAAVMVRAGSIARNVAEHLYPPVGNVVAVAHSNRVMTAALYISKHYAGVLAYTSAPSAVA